MPAVSDARRSGARPAHGVTMSECLNGLQLERSLQPRSETHELPVGAVQTLVPAKLILGIESKMIKISSKSVRAGRVNRVDIDRLPRLT